MLTDQLRCLVVVLVLIYWASAPRKEPIFLAIILFRLCDGVRILEDDDEHENEDDFSTSEFRLK